MAESKTNSDVQRVAQHLFSERSIHVHGRDIRAVAVNCFKDAAAFLAVAEEYNAGMLEEQTAPAGIQLSDASAPNLIRGSVLAQVLPCKNHPHNLVSRAYGDLKKVAAVYKWLKANPLAETASIESLGIEWDVETTKLARILLPEYVVPAEREPALAPA